jgi:hypothetical protein
MRVQASVRVRASVEIAPDTGWGDDCTVAQARSQGIEAALALLDRAIAGPTLTKDRADAIAASIAAKHLPPVPSETLEALCTAISESLMRATRAEWRGRIQVVGKPEVDVVVLTPAT